MKLLVLGLADLCREFQPQEVAIERVFMARNPDSALGQARARRFPPLCCVTCRCMNMPPARSSWRWSVVVVPKATGSTHGRAHAQPETKLQADAADALAVAITHAHVRGPTAWGSVPARRGAANELHAMIGRLRGIVAYKAPPWLVVDVNGVGYELEAPMSTFMTCPNSAARSPCTPITRRRKTASRCTASCARANAAVPRRAEGQWHRREDCAGRAVGVTVEEFARMVQAGDITALTRIPGIGKKTAERMVLELRDRAAVRCRRRATGSGPARPTRFPMPPWRCSSWATSLLKRPAWPATPSLKAMKWPP